jgi:hypothetical protein
VTENPQQSRQPGEWPVPQPVELDEHAYADHDELYVQRATEKALHEMVLGSIRHHLAQQPSPAATRTAAARWKNAITNLADELINTRRTER